MYHRSIAWLTLALLLIAGGLQTSAQNILGKHPADKVLFPAFFAQNTNADSIVLGVNIYATVPFDLNAPAFANILAAIGSGTNGGVNPNALTNSDTRDITFLGPVTSSPGADQLSFSAQLGDGSTGFVATDTSGLGTLLFLGRNQGGFSIFSVTTAGAVAGTSFSGSAGGLVNGSPGLASNNATATDGMALVKRGGNLKLENIVGTGTNAVNSGDAYIQVSTNGALFTLNLNPNSDLLKSNATVLGTPGSGLGFNAGGLTNGSPNLATNNATATDGMALVKRGGNLKLETITGSGSSVSSGDTYIQIGTNSGNYEVTLKTNTGVAFTNDLFTIGTGLKSNADGTVSVSLGNESVQNTTNDANRITVQSVRFPTDTDHYFLLRSNNSSLSVDVVVPGFSTNTVVTIAQSGAATFADEIIANTFTGGGGGLSGIEGGGITIGSLNSNRLDAATLNLFNQIAAGRGADPLQSLSPGTNIIVDYQSSSRVFYDIQLTSAAHFVAISNAVAANHHQATFRLLSGNTNRLISWNTNFALFGQYNSPSNYSSFLLASNHSARAVFDNFGLGDTNCGVVFWLSQGEIATTGGGGGGGSGLTNGLTEYWPMEEGDAATRMGVTANGINLTNHGNVVQESVHIGGSFSARSSTTSSYLDSTNAVFNSTNSFTISFWYYPTAGHDSATIVSRWGISNVWSFFGSGNNIALATRALDNGGNHTVTSTIDVISSLNKWHHVVGGYDSTNQVNWIQVDSETRQTAANTEGLRNGPDGLTFFDISGGSGAAMTISRIDEAGIWIGRVLTTGNVTTMNGSFDFSTQGGAPTFYPDW